MRDELDERLSALEGFLPRSSSRSKSVQEKTSCGNYLKHRSWPKQHNPGQVWAHYLLTYTSFFCFIEVMLCWTWPGPEPVLCADASGKLFSHGAQEKFKVKITANLRTWIRSHWLWPWTSPRPLGRVTRRSPQRKGGFSTRSSSRSTSVQGKTPCGIYLKHHSCPK